MTSLEDSRVDCPPISTNESNLHYETIPPEIWLKIFPYLSRQDIRTSTLVCSSFRYLAQPLLFTVIDVSPFFLAYNTDRRILRPRKYLDRTMQRLRFYRSPHIAPAVTHCWISPYSRTGFPPRNPRDYLDPHLIIDAVIDNLPSFVNLRQLSWHCIEITSKWWHAICKLTISALWLNACTVEDINPSFFPVKHLDLDQWAWEGKVTNHVSIHEEHSPGVSPAVLSLIVHPDHIQYISIPRADTCHHLLSTIVERGTFATLLTLRLPFFAVSSPCFIQALIHCQVLQELTIFRPIDGEPHEITMDSLPPSALSFLVTYEGPYMHMLTFATGRPVKKISIWGLDESPALCDPHRLLESLHQLSLFNDTLEILQMTVSRIIIDLLTVLTSFPLLTCVDITSIDNPSTMPTPVTPSLQLSSKTPMMVLYVLLRHVPLPPKLKSLRISTKLNHGNIDTPTQELEVLRLIEHMAHGHPMLQSVEIAYGTYWTGTYLARWNRLSSSASDSTNTLGKLFFNEHKRTIVFPDAHRSNSWDEDKLTQGGSSYFVWLLHLFHKFKYMIM